MSTIEEVRQVVKDTKALMETFISGYTDKTSIELGFHAYWDLGFFWAEYSNLAYRGHPDQEEYGDWLIRHCKRSVGDVI